MQFANLRLAEPILKALQTEGYHTATPIQAQAIPPALQGRDVLGSAQTGTGKTAAFALPILQRLGAHKGTNHVRALILCPTRELATQINDSFKAYGRNLQVRTTVIFGGVNQNPQVGSLRRGVDVVIATPGRLLDLMNQGFVDLRHVEVLVLDEADRMLDMGFINDIRKVVAKVPPKRQTMLFSATMPREIRHLADSLLRDPAVVQVAPVSSTVETIDQTVYHVNKRNKPLLLAHLVNELPMTRAIVFTRTKHGADRVVRQLHQQGIKAEAIHGNKSQNARQRALDNFKRSKTPVLVATDIASRGIDVDDVSHVVNYDITHEPETYVHRIGRTGRNGASGMAVSLCDHEEVSNLRAIEKLIRRTIPVREDHPTYPPEGEKAAHGTSTSHASSHAHPRSGSSRATHHRDGGRRGGGGSGSGGESHRNTRTAAQAAHATKPRSFGGGGAQPSSSPHAPARPAHPHAKSAGRRPSPGRPQRRPAGRRGW